jgi:hypothetical protein
VLFWDVSEVISGLVAGAERFYGFSHAIISNVRLSCFRAIDSCHFA